jgi:hypothetical protein
MNGYGPEIGGSSPFAGELLIRHKSLEFWEILSSPNTNLINQVDFGGRI